jgi:D-alanine-D-alanine ligase
LDVIYLLGNTYRPGISFARTGPQPLRGLRDSLGETPGRFNLFVNTSCYKLIKRYSLDAAGQMTAQVKGLHMANTVLVLFGGVSTEYIVSLRSAFNIIGGLREAGFRVIRVGITPQGDWLRFEGEDQEILQDTWQADARSLTQDILSGQAEPVLSPRQFLLRLCGCVPDCVFPAVHGINCEDGALQGLLQLAGFPFVGCKVLASAACMDKQHSKKIFRVARIPQVKSIGLSRSDIAKDPQSAANRAIQAVGLPCFLKPNNGGSSVGTCRVGEAEGLPAALQRVSEFDQTVIVEEFVKAREIEVAVMGNERPRAAVVGEVATSSQVDYYDYQAKYFMADGAQVIVPADLPAKTAARVRRLAIKAYKALSCSGLARVDFFLTRDGGRLLINEVNSLPGFTPISIFPKAFAAAGIALPQLLRRLCQLAIAEHAAAARQELL